MIFFSEILLHVLNSLHIVMKINKYFLNDGTVKTRFEFSRHGFEKRMNSTKPTSTLAEV